MKHSIKHYLFKLKWLVAIGIFVIAIGFVGENSWLNRISQKQEISRLKSEIDEYERQFKADKEVLNHLKHDQGAIADVARHRYLMKTEDEDVFVFEE